MNPQPTEWSRSDEATAVEQRKASLRQLQGVGGCVEIPAKHLNKIDLQDAQNTLTLPRTPFSLMNLIRKLIFSLRLLSWTVRSLFGRITVLSKLYGYPANEPREKVALTRL